MVFEDIEHIVYLGFAVTNQGTQSKTEVSEFLRTFMVCGSLNTYWWGSYCRSALLRDTFPPYFNIYEIGISFTCDGMP